MTAEAMLPEGAEETQEAFPREVARFLNWADEKAQAIRAAEVVLEQDTAAEHLRRAAWEARMGEREAKVQAQREDLQRACEAMRRYLLPGRKKSRALPSGLVVAFRARGETVVVQDRAAFMSHARREAPGLLRSSTSYEPSQTRLMEHFRATGELPPGCEYVPAGDDFKVTGAESAEKE